MVLGAEKNNPVALSQDLANGRTILRVQAQPWLAVLGQLNRRLKAMNIDIPVIVITGHADVPLAVEAMKAGIADFIEKPFDDDTILNAIRHALASCSPREAQSAEQALAIERLCVLSPRERQVMEGLVDGKANKVIAYELDISPRTVEIYRAHVMTKTGVKSLSELVRLAMTAGAA